MFKIGNSKELPTIPDHLSEEGKDFVRLCLQRNPIHRPSASQLLRHPFVRSALLERVILNADPSEAPSTVINAVRSLVNAIEICFITCAFNSFNYSIILGTAALKFVLCCLGKSVLSCVVCSEEIKYSNIFGIHKVFLSWVVFGFSQIACVLY